MTMQGLGVAYQGSAMSLITTANNDGNAVIGNGLYRSAKALIIAAHSDGNAVVENGQYRSDMSLIYLETVMAMQFWGMANFDQLCH